MPKYSRVSIMLLLFLQNCTAQEKQQSPLENQKKLEQKLQSLQTQITQKPDDGSFLLQRAYILDSLQNYLEALHDVNNFLEKNPKNVQAYQLRGRLKVKLDDVSGAINDFNKVILLDKDNGEAYFQRALIRLQSGDKSGACREFEKAKKLKYKQADEYWQKICEK